MATSSAVGTKIVAAATERHLKLEFPVAVREQHGLGIEGTVGGRPVALGQLRWLAEGAALPRPAEELRRRLDARGSAAVYVSVDGLIAGACRSMASSRARL